MGACLCKINESFGQGRDNKFRRQWERDYGTIDRHNQRNNLLGKVSR
jgi:hypothetical protein